MGKIIDFDGEFDEIETKLNDLNEDTKEVQGRQIENEKEINEMQKQIEKMLKKNNIKDFPSYDSQLEGQLEWENNLFLKINKEKISEQVQKEIYESPSLLPSLTATDWAIVGSAGILAALIDIIMVRTPNGKITFKLFGEKLMDGEAYSDKFHPTTFLKKNLGVDEEGDLTGVFKWLEDKCKVPYDQSINPDIAGFTPKTHRLLNLAHDPLIGLFFSVFDTINGSMTAIDAKGNFHVVKTVAEEDPLAFESVLFTPLVWIGHCISDVCTKMGLPIPGWGLTQLLQFGEFGEKDRTVADITRYMYLKGYDLRHFATMSSGPAVIEIIVKAYHLLSDHLTSKEVLSLNINESVLEKEYRATQLNMKLHKMLFFSHLIATSGNALKVFASGNDPLSFNLPQWIAFIKECHSMILVSTRTKEPEMIIRNRESIDMEWDSLNSK
ncbi:hypothetical protein [Planococcus sp. NCCP-2050]|uniref:hypothetical protein n=1 Tax=Planococcus sp. NCCP-2050 TaxID=2944679 RepID=UPI00203E94AA|nr:hypothetical protein [Planococcus sp. NCCP-2050]GKW47357.1 hypothetical protein NCCP2050_30490 [Planococcus sp. NCCP-2050]